MSDSRSFASQRRSLSADLQSIRKSWKSIFELVTPCGKMIDELGTAVAYLRLR